MVEPVDAFIVPGMPKYKDFELKMRYKFIIQTWGHGIP